MRLARFELWRLGRGRLTAAALVVLAMIPLLYGALYLTAFWDPYQQLDKIPVALVNEDRPAKASDGSTLHAGQDLADELIKRRVLGWQLTDRTHALQGLDDGRYHLVFEIPADFSANLAGNPDPSRSAEQGHLVVVNNDATNYLSGMLSRNVFAEVRTAAENSAAQRYFGAMLIGFSDAKDQTSEAAGGADQLVAGASGARTGADQVRSGAGTASTGADQLSGGLTTATQGAGALVTGLNTLDAGAAQLADGAEQAAAGGALLRKQIDAAAHSADSPLRQNAAQIAQAATAIADGASTIVANLGSLSDLVGQVQQAQAVVEQLDALVKAHPELAGDKAVLDARSAAQTAANAAGQLGAILSQSGLAQLRDQLSNVASAARQLASGVSQLADGVVTLSSKVDQLTDGLNDLAANAGDLHQGTSQAVHSADQLDGGLYRLSTGARSLDAGLTSLDTGTQRLANGLAGLQNGADQLATGLTGGASKVPGYDPDSIAARAGVLGDPVAMDTKVQNPAQAFGAGFAPYFIGLALWVGAMLSYMILRPLNRRYALSGAPAFRVALANFLPSVVLGVAGAGLLYAVLRVGLGLAPVHPWATLGYLLLVAVAFDALMQWLVAQFGTAGRFIALVLLMLQLTSSDGTYPVQTSPAFFRAIHPYLPMSYVVGGLRHLIDGGATGTVVTEALVLAGFAVAAFALSVVAARRARRMSPSSLHPELVL